MPIYGIISMRCPSVPNRLDRTEILKGKCGDHVIRLGQYSLRDGAKVKAPEAADKEKAGGRRQEGRRGTKRTRADRKALAISG